MHKVTICPCCGFRFEGDLRNGCEGCGARSVGEPLPKPEQELPGYGRSLLLTITGLAMVLGFLTETVLVLAKKVPVSLGFWNWIAAGETAAWRLKWIALPVTFVVLWSGLRIYRSMAKTPARFIGMKLARRGLLASAVVCCLIVILIGVTVPARLRQRRLSIEAGQNAKAYTLIRAQLEYQAQHNGTIPTDITDLKYLPDTDGSIAAALAEVDPDGYQARVDIAVLPVEKGRRLAGAAIRNASVSTSAEDQPASGLGITNYDLRLPGEDKLLRTDDDLLIRDGVIYKASEVKDAPIPVRAPARAGRR
jgi:hypothetical protein